MFKWILYLSIVLKPSLMKYLAQHLYGVLPLLQPVEVVSLTGIPLQVIQLPPVPDVPPVWPLGVEVGVLEANPLCVAELGSPHRVA